MMKEFSAGLYWKQQPHDSFLRGKYSRAHTWKLDGGSLIEASASPAIVPVPFSNPECIDPEEAFVLSLASCHMLFFLSIAAKMQINVSRYEDNPVGTLEKTEAGHVAITKIILRPRVVANEMTPADKISHIHHRAHQNCFIANSIKTKVEIITS